MNRRTILTGLAGLVAAPAVLRLGAHMPVRAVEELRTKPRRPVFGHVRLGTLPLDWSLYCTGDLIYQYHDGDAMAVGALCG